MTGEQAKKEKPKHPTPAYFKFRAVKLKELEG